MPRRSTEIRVVIVSFFPNGAGEVRTETTSTKVKENFEYYKSLGKEALVLDSIGRVIGHSWCENGIWKSYLEN